MAETNTYIYVYLFLTCVTVIFGDIFKVFLVLGVVPFSMYIVKILFSAGSEQPASDSISEPVTHQKTLKRPPKCVIYKHIAPNCYKLSDAERISAQRELLVTTNHVFRTSPNGFEYSETDDTYISELCPYYRCQRKSETEFKVLT